jgi:hypothetical protein
LIGAAVSARASFTRQDQMPKSSLGDAHAADNAGTCRQQGRTRLRTAGLCGGFDHQQSIRKQTSTQKEESMRSRGAGFGILFAALVGSTVLSAAQAGHVLITEDEARLPPPHAGVADRRGITRGPRIDFMHPGEPVHLPMHFQVRFAAFGGATIDLDAVKVTYLRTPNVDLTPRVRPFLQASGIDIPDVELPAGEHMVRIDVKDSEGRAGTTSFVLKVAH